MWVWSLGQEDPLEGGHDNHSSILAWRSPWTEKPRLQSQRVIYEWSNTACMHTQQLVLFGANCHLFQRRQWHPTPVLLLGNPWMEEPGRLQSMGSRRVGHDWVTSLSLFSFMHWRRKWQTHSSILAWRIPGMGEPGGLPSMGSHRVGHDWSNLAATAKS